MKYKFTKNQIVGVMLEQTNRTISLPTVWNKYNRKKLDATYVKNFILQMGVYPEDIGQFLKDKRRYLSTDITRFLTEIGWSPEQIKQLKLPKVKIAKRKNRARFFRKNRGNNNRWGGSTRPGGSLGSTGKIGSSCVGGNCNESNSNPEGTLREEKKIMRKYIFTESQLKNIVDSVIEESIQLTEQEEEKKRTVAIQKFLNSVYPKLTLVTDGIIGPKTKKAIANYQTKIGVYPVDGIWGPETEKKMPEKHKVLFKAFIKESDDIFDKIVKFFTSNKQQ